MVDVWIMSAAAARRSWLSGVVAAERSLRVKGAAPALSLLKTFMSESAADVAVIDLDTTAANSEQIRGPIYDLTDRIPVLCLTPEAPPALFSRMIAAGAGGILSPDAPAARVVDAIKGVASGLLIFEGSLAAQSYRRDDNDPALLENLTRREIEVLELLAEGLGNKEIAAQLNVSQHTIKFHIASILAKLGASSRTEAVSRGLRSGLIDL